MPPKAAAKFSPESLEPLRLAARLHKTPVYLVGGALRDLLLGRAVADLDLACSGAQALGKRLAAALNGAFVTLDEENAVYRVALPAAAGPLRQVDLAELQGAGIAEDLQRRDFTINALALALTPDMPAAVSPKALLDPRGGAADLETRLLRCENVQRLKEDPLRILRAFRIAAQLDFALDPGTLEMIVGLKHRVRSPAGERLQAELMLLLDVPGASRWLRVMDQAGVLTALFEELEPARQCAEVYYGPGGVMTHSLDTAARADLLMSHIGRVFPDKARAIEEELARRGAEGLPMRALVLLAALLHDVSKAETAKSVDGRLRFFGHDALGAKRAGEILKRLRFSGAQTALVCAVIGNHLRPGNLAAGGEITEKAAYRFFRDLGANALALLLVCWADHASYVPEERLLKALKLAALEPGKGGASLARVKPQEAQKTIYHLQVISHLMRRLFDEDKKPVPERLIDGTDVMKTLGLKPGPAVGEWLERAREAQAEGKISTRDEALALLREQSSNPGQT